MLNVTTEMYHRTLYGYSSILKVDFHNELLQKLQSGSAGHKVPYSMGIRVLSPGVKRPRREVNYSPPSSAEVENEPSYTSIPLPPCFHGVGRGNFISISFLEHMY
jgi:hypothetical protein